MKKNFTSKLLLGTFAMMVACTSAPKEYYPDTSHTNSPGGVDVFQPDSLSILENYTIPEWFTNSKLGIFIHWGVYSVPAYGSEWYSRLMYTEGSAVNKYHRKTYGELTEFGYKDFVPMFKAEKFDPQQWAKVIKSSGAKYVVPVAEHHDGFAMYDSRFNPWNSVDMGPQRDIIGELSKAIRQEGLIFGLSSHRAENAWFYNQGLKCESDAQDMSISMYGQRIEQPEGKGMTAEYGRYPGSNEESRAQWLLHMYELIDLYKPELIWFDWTVGKYPFQPTFYKFMAYYYNNAVEWGKDVIVNTKVGYSDQSQVFDIERGKSDRIRRYPWQTDTSIGNISWSYTPNEENKTPNHVIDDFVDIVSKNGNLLLNIGPKSDGTISAEQQSVLEELGGWLEVNGSAIYNTRPWVRWSEGENKGTAGYMTDGHEATYTSSDVRFTCASDTLYAIALQWGDSPIMLESLSSANGSDIAVKSVSMLGTDQGVDWTQSASGLELNFPADQPTDYAHVFSIVFEGVVYGDIQAEYVAGDVVVEQYVHNATDAPRTVTVSCTNNSSSEQSSEVVVAPHSKAITTFTFKPDGDLNNLQLSVNGKLISEKTININKKPSKKH